MEKESLSEVTVKRIFSLTPVLTTLPMAKLWIDYDREVDVLYVGFKHPQHATHSDMLDNGVLLNYQGEKIVGMTIFEASTRVPASSAQ